jgi:hypothetical protein
MSGTPVASAHPIPTRHILCASLLAALLLAGCESTPDMPKTPDLPSVPAVVEVEPVNADSDVTDRVGQAAITPLSDLNVVQEKIPEVLRHAKQVGAYALPEPLECAVVQDEINRLTAALGPDLDDPNTKGKPSLLDRGTDAAENYGVGFVRRTMEGFVPFRSWLRKLTGAEKHSKEVAAAIMAGGVRRAYLKGMRRGMGCAVPEVKAPLLKTSPDQAASAASAASSAAPSAPTPASAGAAP